MIGAHEVGLAILTVCGLVLYVFFVCEIIYELVRYEWREFASLAMIIGPIMAFGLYLFFQ